MNDPIVDEVRRIRDAHAARFNYDLDGYFRISRSEKSKAASYSFKEWRVSRCRTIRSSRPGPPFEFRATFSNCRRPRQLSFSVRQLCPSEVQS